MGYAPAARTAEPALLDVADIANAKPGEVLGGMLLAGVFLKEFVGEGIPWAHLDIAGPANNSAGAFGYTPKGASGALLGPCSMWSPNPAPVVPASTGSRLGVVSTPVRARTIWNVVEIVDEGVPSPWLSTHLT